MTLIEKKKFNGGKDRGSYGLPKESTSRDSSEKLLMEEKEITEF